MIKKIISTSLALAAAALMATVSVSAQSEEIIVNQNTVNIVAEGERVSADNFLYNDTTYIQLRRVAEILDKTVIWDEAAHKVNIKDGESEKTPDDEMYDSTERYDKIISVDRNTVEIYVNDTLLNADNFIYEGRTYVSLRKVAEAFSKNVDFDNMTFTAIIGKGEKSVFEGNVLGKIGGREYTDTLYNGYKKFYGIMGFGDEETDVLALGQIKSDYALEKLANENGISLGVSFENNYAKDKDAMIRTYGEEEYEKMLAENGFTDELYKHIQKETAIYAKLMESPQFAPSESEITGFYHSNLDDVFLYDGIRAKHILILADFDGDGTVTDDDLKNGLDKAKKIAALAQKGENFERLIQMYNQDTGEENYPDGYVFKRGEMVEEFENACYDMKIGEVSDPVKTQYGYHIIKVYDKIKYYSLDDGVRQYIKEQLADEKLSKAVNDLANSFVFD